MSKSISPETVIGPYRVVSQIGEGGMGEVSMAEDSRLHRKVALQILPSEMASNQIEVYTPDSTTKTEPLSGLTVHIRNAPFLLHN